MSHRHYARHLDEIQQRYATALAEAGFDGVVIGSGLPVPVFRDDQDHPYRPEPLFLQWAPLAAHPGSAIVFRPGHRPLLLVHQPEDYWHQAAPVPRGPWERRLDLRVLKERSHIRRHLPRGRSRLAWLGDPAQWRGLGLPAGGGNPRSLMNRLDYARAVKTAWEVDCIRRATVMALAGHRAVEEGFRAGLSEYELGLLFLAACGQTDAELPYPAIIAMNRNGATLHYQHRQRARPARGRRHSLLLDAGCSHLGYASDITRTWAAGRGEFAAMVRDTHRLQQDLCQQVRPGVSFPELQLAAHRAIATALRDWDLVRMAPEDMVDARITDHFFPHGLGHLLGLQVHDVGGGMVGPRGGELPRPARFPRLRLTRRLEPGQVVTIEPGIYFIDSLLARLRGSRHRRSVNWRRLKALAPCGGIRIEDDVLVTARGHDNLTRSLSGGD